MIDCCSATIEDKICIRKKDSKQFKLPRKYSKKKCTENKIKGFTMKSSCAPYKYCKKKKLNFLYNPDNPKKSFDVYINKNPEDTINIKYTTVNDVKNTITKLEKLYKSDKYPHKRIWQVGMILKVRLESLKKNKKELYPNAKDVKKRFDLANQYFQFLGKRTKLKEKDRKLLVFKYKKKIKLIKEKKSIKKGGESTSKRENDTENH